MIYAVIFAEGGLGSDFIYIIIAILLVIAIIGGAVGSLISLIINSFLDIKKNQNTILWFLEYVL